MDWSNKTVLVTGAAGFIGSHMAEALVERGAKVCAFTHYNALGRRGWLDTSSLVDEMDIIAGDIADPHSVEAAMNGVDVVFHLAALIAIPYSYVAPGSYVQTNIHGTLNVLQAARRLGTERVLHTSTSEVYGTARYVPIDEAHPLQGQSPYSATKISADKLAESFYLSFDTPVITIRPFNTFGPRQSTRAVIPTIITQLLRGTEVHLGSVTPTRDLNYVSNTVEGFIKGAEAPAAALGQAINLGSNTEISIGDLATKIAGLMGKDIDIVTEEQRMRPEKSEVNRLVAANERARELLGWSPSVSLDEGLSRSIDWYKENLKRYRPDEYTI